jgi:hypothetical protein
MEEDEADLYEQMPESGFARVEIECNGDERANKTRKTDNGMHEDGSSSAPRSAMNAERSQWLKDEGNAFMRSEDFATAAQKYTDALHANPTNIAALCNRALAFLKLQVH